MRMRNTPESEPRPSTCTYLIARAKNTFSSLNRIQTEKFVAPVAAKREETRENAAPSQLKEKHLSVAFTVAAASSAEPAYDETILLRGSPLSFAAGTTVRSRPADEKRKKTRV